MPWLSPARLRNVQVSRIWLTGKLDEKSGEESTAFDQPSLLNPLELLSNLEKLDILTKSKFIDPIKLLRNE